MRGSRSLHFVLWGALLWLASPVWVALAETSAPAAPHPLPRLLEQLGHGEARQDRALIAQTLSRLTAVAPDAPLVLEARVRDALRRDALGEAEALVHRLERYSPRHPATRRAALNLDLARPAGRQALGEARLQAAAGHLEEARARYQALLHPEPPTLPLALEYWELMARLPGQTPTAIQALQRLDSRYPGSPRVNFTLARLLLAEGRPSAAYDRFASLASDVANRDEAARRWFAALQDAPVAEATRRGWQMFLDRFPDHPRTSDARETLSWVVKRLDDPAFRAGQRGLAALSEEGAIPATELERAVTAYPEDPDLVAGLGIVRLRQGRHGEALVLFRRGRALEDDAFSSQRWAALIETARYWQQVAEGNRALAENDLGHARRHFHRARRLDAAESAAWIGLGNVARGEGDVEAARRAYGQARRLAPDDLLPIERLAELHAEYDPRRALAFLEALPANSRRALASLRQRIRLSMLRDQARRLADRSRWQEAETTYREAATLAPTDPWLVYGVAESLRHQGHPDEGDAAFEALHRRLETLSQRDQARYAQALYLSGINREARALAVIEAIPEARRDDAMQALSERLTLASALEEADRLRDAGQAAAARKRLHGLAFHPRVALRLADWAQQRGDPKAAIGHYDRALDRLTPGEAGYIDARLGKAEALHALDDTAASRRLLDETALAEKGGDDRRRAANLWLALGESERAAQVFESLLADPDAAASPLVWRDSARLASSRGRPRQALKRYREGLIAAGLAPPSARGDDAALTRATREPTTTEASADATPAWLADNLRRETADTYRQLTARLAVDHLTETEGGTAGVSALTKHTQMLEVDAPLPHAGRAFVRVDRVTLDAGRFEASGQDGQVTEVFGTCAVVGCNIDGKRSREQGVSVGAGWYDDTWRLDVGTTPLGFPRQTWVGGIEHRGEFGELWRSATFSRRPVTSSLLAFAGARDPNTGRRWGGVLASGASLGLGYDEGGAYGVWSSLGYHRFTGEHVADNHRLRLMGGIYHRWRNRPDTAATVGVNLLGMRYRRDLGGYALGQGGYYSPDSYLSVSLPLRYQQRTTDWLWELESGVSYAWSRQEDHPRYPLDDATVTALPDGTAIESGGSGGGVGFSAAARLERRLGDHWRAGASLALSSSEDYSPATAGFYLRFSPRAWQGELSLDSEPLTPYADLP